MLHIRELRENAGLTQKQLADDIHSMQRNISNWENGTSEPDLETVVTLADYFGVTLDELFGRETNIRSTDAQLVSAVRRLSQEKKYALLMLLNS